MDLRISRYKNLLILSGLTLIFSQIGVFAYFCTVPLHLLAKRYSGKKFYYTALLLASAVLLWDVVRILIVGFDREYLLLGAIVLFYPSSLLIGILGYYLPDVLHIRRVYRLLIAAAVPSAAGCIIIAVMNSGSSGAMRVEEFYYQAFTAVMDMMTPGASLEGIGNSLFNISMELVKATFIPLWVVLFGFGILVSEIFSRRSFEKSNSPTLFHHFKAPDTLLWPFIGSWIAVLLDVVFSIGTIGDIAWNSALLVSLIYGTSGFSILIFMMEKRNMKVRPAMLAVTMIIFLFIPGVNVIILIALPVLGLAEHWIHFRGVSKEKTDENNS